MKYISAISSDGLVKTIAIGILALGIADPLPVNAQDRNATDAGGSPQKSAGVIIYSRDVPYGTATARGFDGQANTVQVDQSDLIERSLANGLTPLSASEAAAVAAPLKSVGNVIENSLATVGLGQDADGMKIGPSGATPVDLGGQIAGTVQNGMASLGSALSSLRGAMDGNP